MKNYVIALVTFTAGLVGGAAGAWLTVQACDKAFKLGPVD